MTYLSSFQMCVAVLVLIAAAMDIRWRKIPNWLSLSGVCAGLLLHGVTGGAAGLATSLEGMLLGFGAYLALYCLRAMGAGDVKLMAAVGAIVGPANWVSVFVATAMAGGVFSFALIVAKGRVKQTLWNVFFIVDELIHLRPPHHKRSDLDVKDSRSLKMPHGVAIAAGTTAPTSR
jgi:prepilin peptidase CpaA